MWNDCWYHQLINNKTFWYLHRSCRVFGTGAAVGALRNFCWATSFADVQTRKKDCAGRNHGSKFPLLFFQNTHCQMQFPAQPKFSRRYLQRSVAYRLVFSRYRGGISGLRLAHSLFGEQELVEKAMRIGETRKKKKRKEQKKRRRRKRKSEGLAAESCWDWMVEGRTWRLGCFYTETHAIRSGMIPKEKAKKIETERKRKEGRKKLRKKERNYRSTGCWAAHPADTGSTE